jgi:polyhydroxybutyrate depolymerase
LPDWSDTIEAAGQRRTYFCHLPAGAATGPRPLLIALHGRRLSVAELRRLTHLDAVADRHGFLVAYPEGLQRSWNDGRGNSPAAWQHSDDVAFIARLIDHLVASAGIDPARVVAAGLSNGGVMCLRLALELSERLAAIASVAGLMPASLANVQPSHAVSVLLIHGTADTYAPITGGRAHGTVPARLVGLLLGRRRGGPSLSLEASAARWRAINGCAGNVSRDWSPATETDPTSIERVCSARGRGGTAVECRIVHGGGHTWPGGPRLLGLGRTSGHFDASEAIWSFATSHFVPAAQRRLDRHETGRAPGST